MATAKGNPAAPGSHDVEALEALTGGGGGGGGGGGAEGPAGGAEARAPEALAEASIPSEELQRPADQASIRAEEELRRPADQVSSVEDAATLVLHWVSGAQAATLQAGPSETVYDVKVLAAEACRGGVPGGCSFGPSSCLLLSSEHGVLPDGSTMRDLGFAGRAVTLQMVLAAQRWNAAIKGANAVIDDCGSRASRTESFSKAVVFCVRPARRCRVRIAALSETAWAGSLQVGFTQRAPESLRFNAHIGKGDDLKDVVCSRTSEAWTPLLLEGAVVEWELSDRGHILVRLEGEVWTSNQKRRIRGERDVFPMASIYGKTAAIELVL